MSAVDTGGFGGKPGRGGSQDFELNLASIIDAFTVLIAFMLASASFLSVGILDAGVAAAGAAPTNTAPPPVNVTLELSPSHQITMRLQGKVNSTTIIAPAGTPRQDWDFAKLAENLNSVRSRWPDVNALTLKADDSVAYNEVVRTMEAVRQSLPVVLLGGF